MGFWAAQGQGISPSNLRTRLVGTRQAVRPDSMSWAPHTLLVMHTRTLARLSDSSYHVRNDTIFWNAQSMLPDSVLLQYRVLPANLTAVQTLLDTAVQRSTNDGGIVIGTYNPNQGTDPLSSNRNLQYNGSFSRGLSFGNRQDLVLNSSFNLQMAGELGDGIRVTAAITDESLPIQPEGNTRQLRDFDQIFIRLERGPHRLTAGDYELTQAQGYFTRYYKRLEGATFQTQQQVGMHGNWLTQGSVAISRGQFRRQIIQAQEGNQGPYKLQGAQGERFIIVLAGTEKVFLDGELLLRGRDADYTIDYNQGEVRFTPRRLITKDSRISVEFEYADQRYLRTMYAGSTAYTGLKGGMFVNLYSQQDSKNATGDLPLSDLEKQLLRNAGDSPGNTLVSTVDTLLQNDSQRSTYRWVDTLTACGPAQALVYDPGALLIAAFANVGEGAGNYILDTEQAANERVYKWVAPNPETCAPTGSYEPVRNLAAPQLQRLLEAGGHYKTGRNGLLNAEIAISEQDKNRFSAIGDADNRGAAAHLRWQQHWYPGKDTTTWQLGTRVGTEWVQAAFAPVNPYRSPEFLRDWSLTDVNGQAALPVPTDEWLFEAGVDLRYKNWLQMGYSRGGFRRTGSYRGDKNQAFLHVNKPLWRLQAGQQWVHSNADGLGARFTRPNVTLQKAFAKPDGWRIGLNWDAERSERRAVSADTLHSRSFAFSKWAATAQSPEGRMWQWGSALRQRVDELPFQGNLSNSSRAREAELVLRREQGKTWTLGANATYRNLEVWQPGNTSLQPASTLLGRVDAGINMADGALRANTTYEIGSGQEPRIEFVYLFVGAGRGQYIWLDSLYNNDGKIQPNEMEIAPFADLADHVRVSIYTDDFIRTNTTTLNQSLLLDPSRKWRKSEQPWRRFLSRFDWQTSVAVNRQVREHDGVQSWNPLQLQLPDSSLVALSASQRHFLNFNRRSSRYDVQLEWLRQPRRQVPVTGFEARDARSNTLKLRWNATDALSIRSSAAQTERSADSEVFNNKDYRLQGYQLVMGGVYQPGQKYRAEISFNHQFEENRLPETQEALTRNELKTQFSYERWLNAGLSYIAIELRGDARSPVGFTLLNGLQPGRNWLWNLNATQSLGKYLQLSISYEGRQTGQAAVVHVGRAQVTAIF